MHKDKTDLDQPDPTVGDDPVPEPATAEHQQDTPAQAPEPDELAELEQFIAELTAVMEPDSQLEHDLEQWKESVNDVL